MIPIALTAISALTFAKDFFGVFSWGISLFFGVNEPTPIVLSPNSEIATQLEVRLAKYARSQDITELKNLCIEFGETDDTICGEVNSLVVAIETKKRGVVNFDGLDAEVAVSLCDLEARRPPTTDLVAEDIIDEPNINNNRSSEREGKNFQDLNADQTIYFCSKAAKANPELGRMFYQLGLGYVAKFNFDLAASNFKKAIEAKHYRAHEALGYLYGGGLLGGSKTKQAYAEFEKGYKNGDLSSAVAMAKYKVYGFGTNVDGQGALEILRSAIRGRSAGAAMRLGIMHRDGVYVEQNRTLAYQNFLDAAKFGAGDGYAYMASMRLKGYKGQFSEQNDRMAVELLRKGIEAGNSGRSIHLLGRCFAQGRGVVRDGMEALRLYKLAWSKKYFFSSAIIGRMYLYGRNGVQKDIEAARYWFNANTAAGRSDGFVELARMLFDGDDGGVTEENDKAAIHFLKNAIQRDDNAWANRYLSWAYREGRGVKPDPKKAISILTRMIKRKDSYANVMMAYHLRKGSGIERNIDKALEAYKAGYKSGSIDANVDIADVYISGEHSGFISRQTDKIAVKYIDEAIKYGNSWAINYKAWLYDTGRYYERDKKRAVKLYKKAADLGNSTALLNLGNIYAKVADKPNIERAIEAYRSAIQQRNTDGYWRLATLLQQQKATVDKNMRIVPVKVSTTPIAVEENVAKPDGNSQLTEPVKRKIIELLEKGKSRLNTKAIYRLGEIYSSGNIAEESETNAVKHFKLAAANGHGSAAYILFLTYVDKYNVAKDGESLRVAMQYLTRGADLNDYDSMQMLVNLHAGGSDVRGSPINRNCNLATVAFEKFIRWSARRFPYASPNLYAPYTSSPFVLNPSDNQQSDFTNSQLSNCPSISNSLETFEGWLKDRKMRDFPGVTKQLNSMALQINAKRYWRGKSDVRIQPRRYEIARDYFLTSPNEIGENELCSLFYGLVDEGKMKEAAMVWENDNEFRSNYGDQYYCTGEIFIEQLLKQNFSEESFLKLLNMKGRLAKKYLYGLHFFALKNEMVKKIGADFIRAAAHAILRNGNIFLRTNREWGAGIVETLLAQSNLTFVTKQAIATAIYDGVSNSRSANRYFELLNTWTGKINAGVIRNLQRKLLNDCSLKIAALDHGVTATVDGILSETTMYALQLISSGWEFEDDNGGKKLVERRCKEL